MSIRPATHQTALPKDRIIVEQEPDADEAIPFDVVFVGAGPAGLAGAIELARLVKADKEAGGGLGDVEIGVLEKAGQLGEHSLSGAVVNPRAFRELFPDVAESDLPFRRPVTKEKVLMLSKRSAWRLPTPPTMKNHGNHIASLCEIVRWLGEKAEAAGINVLTGFPVEKLYVQGNAVVGLRTVDAGLGRDGQPTNNHEPGSDIAARITVLSEGTRGMLSQAWMQWQNVSSKNPQLFALGVKELWETKKPLDHILHTMGWPLPNDAFGGSFMYPLEDNLVALGLVVGMDYRDTTLDVHQLLQQLKLHPTFRPYLEGGTPVEWGAKTIPEGGYWSLPDRLHGDGLILAGDAAGFVDVPSLKGIHYAMQSGMFAARAVFAALKADDTSAAKLGEYDTLVHGSYIKDDMYRTRNMRLAFKRGFYRGGIDAGLMTITGGRFPGGRYTMHADADAERREVAEAGFVPDGKLTFSKVDSVFRSGNATRDTVPQHLTIGTEPGQVPEAVARFWSHVCPAGVYEVNAENHLVVNAPNCVDCKATDVVGPRWSPREGGSGPKYRRM
ncbi:MAG: 4Fe-4S dicluster domain-containing protein [Planctomycetota bacterium]